jgi:hypothetical protein
MPKAVKFVPTTVGSTMLAMLRKVHQHRRIAIFAGPPGIGKTTAVQAFAEEHAGSVIVLKLDRTGKQGTGARIVMQEAAKALSALMGLGSYVYLDTFQVRRQLAELIRQYGLVLNEPRLTLVFDEAQNLSRDAIETLRYWNDEDRCFAPFSIGLVFVGNSEFALSPGKGGKSVISGAVADRARYIESFDYSSVENDDLRLILAAHGITDARIVAAVIAHYATGRQSRSLRSLVDYKIPLMKDLAGDQPIQIHHAQEALAA